MPTALTIAGSDSGGGAGIQADLKTFAAHGVHGLTAVTAITAQNTRSVEAVALVSPAVVAAQIDAVAADFEIDAVKTGMLATADIVAAVCEALARHPMPPIVVDPVLVASSGHRLTDDDALRVLRDRLVPLARLVTPNRREAEALTGLDIRSPADLRQAAARLRRLGARAVVITGGDADGAESVDLLDDDGAVTELRGARVDSRHTHGTGCTFSAAATAGLARGLPLAEAVTRAKRFVETAIRQAPGLGRGRGPLGHIRADERQ